MNRKVLVTVTGHQNSPETGEDTIEIMAAGEYFCKGGKHFLLYEEAMDESDILTHNRVKFQPGYLEVTKKGLAETHMLFEAGKETLSHYLTPYGEMQIGFRTSDVVVIDKGDTLTVRAVYAMDINCEFVADCTLTIQIRSSAL